MFARALVTTTLTLALLAPVRSGAREGEDARVSSAVEVCRTYFEAMDSADLDGAEKLFAEESLIFETGGVEGDWKRYREHHLGPELEVFLSFETTLGEPNVISSTDRSLNVVAWPIEYQIKLEDERVIESRGTVTFVLTEEDDQPRIRHLHWSSRKKSK